MKVTTNLKRALLPIVAAGLPVAAPAQFSLSEFLDREDELQRDIALEEVQNGPYSETLLEPLTALSLLYEEAANYSSSDATTDRVLQVLRANHGLHTMEQTDAIWQLIARNEDRGNRKAAWDLEQELLELVARHPEDPRTGRILRGIGDRRADMLERYEAGEIVPEIVYGCYYAAGVGSMHIAKRGSRPMQAFDPDGDRRNQCSSGSRPIARGALASDMNRFYGLALNSMIRNEGFEGEDIPELLELLVRNSYRYAQPPLGRQSLENLVTFQRVNESGPVAEIEALIMLGDWYLYYAPGQGTAFRDRGMENYVRAWELLEENGLATSEAERYFAPEVPIFLPGIFANPLVRDPEPGAGDYIDVSFVVESTGKSASIEFLDSTTGVTRADQRDLNQLIKHNLFRPTLVDGEPVDSNPFVVRYWVDNR